MDRLRLFSCSKGLAAALLATAALSSGCRSTRSEVPPGKPYARTGEETPAVGFSTQPHPANAGTAPGPVNLGPGGLTDDRLAGTGNNTAETMYGTPTRGSTGVSVPTANRYGPPGTSGMDPTAGAGSAEIADALMDTGQSVSKQLADDASVKKANALVPNQ